MLFIVRCLCCTYVESLSILGFVFVTMSSMEGISVDPETFSDGPLDGVLL